VRVFREDPLLKVGVVLMGLALALVIAAVVVSVALRSEPGRVVAAEVAAKNSQGEPQRPSSGEPPQQHYDSSSYRAEEKVREPRPVVRQEAEAPPPKPDPTPTSQPEPAPKPRPDRRLLPAEEGSGWPAPTEAEVQRANGERHYDLTPGAIMALTVEQMGIHDAPVFDSDSRWALANGISHDPETSLPWSPTAQRNVYLAGHRMGYRGTWSRMIFYNLDELEEGDRVLLRDRSGRAYEYEVSEVFLAEPTDVWVMGQVRGRDMVTLQTCTPIPTFHKRLIVRADRV